MNPSVNKIKNYSSLEPIVEDVGEKDGTYEFNDSVGIDLDNTISEEESVVTKEQSEAKKAKKKKENTQRSHPTPLREINAMSKLKKNIFQTAEEEGEEKIDEYNILSGREIVMAFSAKKSSLSLEIIEDVGEKDGTDE